MSRPVLCELRNNKYLYDCRDLLDALILSLQLNTGLQQFFIFEKWLFMRRVVLGCENIKVVERSLRCCV